MLQDALRFPLIGGAVLCGLFALFKFLPKELVNRVLSLYFVALGALACTATVAPFVARLLPRSLQGKAWEVKQLTIPLVLTVRMPMQPSVMQRADGMNASVASARPPWAILCFASRPQM